MGPGFYVLIAVVLMICAGGVAFAVVQSRRDIGAAEARDPGAAPDPADAAADGRLRAEVRVGVWNVAWGVFLGGILLAVAAALAYGGDSLLNELSREARASRYEATMAAEERAEKIVSPEFMGRAREAASLVDSEYAAAKVGWNSFRKAKDRADAAISALDADAKTEHENDIALKIQSGEMDFRFCVEEAIQPPYPGGGLSECFSEYPRSQIDGALEPPPPRR